VLTSSSVIPHPYDDYGPTSLVEGLFSQAGKPIRLMATPTSEIRCDHCARVSFSIVGDCIVSVGRHGSDYHKTVIPLAQLGLKRADE
jgi:hypothetical protein